MEPTQGGRLLLLLLRMLAAPYPWAPVTRCIAVLCLAVLTGGELINMRQCAQVAIAAPSGST
jgi:hypothetical protein